MRPARNVPTVSTTAGASNVMPVTVTTPRTRPPCTMRSATSCWKSARFGWFSSRRRMTCLCSCPAGRLPSLVARGREAWGRERLAPPGGRGRQRRLGAGMAAADDDDVVDGRESLLADNRMHDYLTALRPAAGASAGSRGTRIVGPQTPRTRPRLALCSGDRCPRRADRKSRMRTALRALGAGALLVPGLTAGLAADAPGLALSACELEHPLRLTALPAECGVLSVAENPHDPSGRHIGLPV